MDALWYPLVAFGLLPAVALFAAIPVAAVQGLARLMERKQR